MIGSKNAMFILSLGLLFVGAGIVAAEENIPKTDETVQTGAPEVDATVQTGAPEVDETAQTGAPEVNEETKLNGDSKVNEEPGYCASCWNYISNAPSNSWEFAQGNLGKTGLMVIGVATIVRITYGFFAEEETSNIRRRPRFNSLSPRLESTD